MDAPLTRIAPSTATPPCPLYGEVVAAYIPELSSRPTAQPWNPPPVLQHLIDTSPDRETVGIILHNLLYFSTASQSSTLFTPLSSRIALDWTSASAQYQIVILTWIPPIISPELAFVLAALESQLIEYRSISPASVQQQTLRRRPEVQFVGGFNSDTARTITIQMGDVQSPPKVTEYPIVDSHQGVNAASVSPIYVDEKLRMEAQGIPHPQHQQYGPPQHAFSSQLDMAQQPAAGRPGNFNMNNMANALPQSNMRHGHYVPGGQPQHQQQRFSPATSSPSMMPQMPQMAPQYPGQGAMPMGNPQYYMPQHHQMQHYYTNQLSPTQQQARPNMGYYPNQMVMNHPQHNQIPQGYYYPPAGHYSQNQALHNPMVSSQYMGTNTGHSDPIVMPQMPNGIDPSGMNAPSSHRSSGIARPVPVFGRSITDRTIDVGDGRSGVVRGPPRKPRQSGHAIWVGNLPPQTDLMNLVHHVCKEANGLESLFLISKSNCAFANFKDEQTCVTAQQKLHDSKFQSVRLVSRLRKSTVEGATGVTAPTGPAASSGSQTPHDVVAPPSAPEAAPEAAVAESNDVKPVTTVEATSQKDKFFILKSLTVEDLELSVRTGIWATQSHNEDTLNAAFNAVDNVYLVFSANKSGEYFGYARMTSQINEDPDAAIEFAPKAQSANDVDLPKAIPTEPTEFAPRGRIIDDSARGTIFWEAEREDGEGGDEEEETEVEQSDASSRKSGNQEADGTTKAWGKPFKLEWLSTARLPFYRTRGLRNPWNSNREVKIARDGTELEPSVGRRLIGLFNRVQSPGPGSVPAMRPGMAMIAGYPPMRPQYQQ
ncbi:hypothetical protein CSAL01_04424 [Colletotrichum salicis]|uniref:YTH domain-containing protein n=1 Tax=Colletotrichum salicis TaxID=1209931 RepID=A0A135SE20_9PEZI|nr:hypothetical protein CSAL01_04424 [Colletotrichum salicis]